MPAIAFGWKGDGDIFVGDPKVHTKMAKTTRLNRIVTRNYLRPLSSARRVNLRATRPNFPPQASRGQASDSVEVRMPSLRSSRNNDKADSTRFERPLPRLPHDL